MAIFRSGLAGGLIREQAEAPLISTPEQGESYLLKALAHIEDYSKLLVASTNSVENELRERMTKAANVASIALTNQSKIIGDFERICNNELSEFRDFLESVEELEKGLLQVDQLYEDVMKLSDVISALEDQCKL